MAIISTIPRPIFTNTPAAVASSESAASGQTAPDANDALHHGHGTKRSHTAPGGRALNFRPANLQMARQAPAAQPTPSNLASDSVPLEVPVHGHHHGGKSPHHAQHAKDQRLPQQAWDRRLPRTNLHPTQQLKPPAQEEESKLPKPEVNQAGALSLPAFTFAPLKRSDFVLLGQWLAAPHVARWWNESAEPGAIETLYGGCIDGTQPVAVFIAYLGDTPMGLVRHHAWHDYPEQVRALEPTLEVPQAAHNIDYFLGAASALGSGLGGHMVQQFCAQLWQSLPSVSCLLVSSHAQNHASGRTLQRAGFALVATAELTLDHPTDDLLHCIYRLDRV
jgi:aminoglycoside 6'-N-acetyltransferase